MDNQRKIETDCSQRLLTFIIIRRISGHGRHPFQQYFCRYALRTSGRSDTGDGNARLPDILRRLSALPGCCIFAPDFLAQHQTRFAAAFDGHRHQKFIIQTPGSGIWPAPHAPQITYILMTQLFYCSPAYAAIAARVPESGNNWRNRQCHRRRCLRYRRAAAKKCHITAHPD